MLWLWLGFWLWLGLEQLLQKLELLGDKSILNRTHCPLEALRNLVRCHIERGGHRRQCGAYSPDSRFKARNVSSKSFDFALKASRSLSKLSTFFRKSSTSRAFLLDLRFKLRKVLFSRLFSALNALQLRSGCFG